VVVVFSLLPVAPALGWPAWVVVGLALVYLVLVAPVSGRRRYRQMLASDREGDATALTRLYRGNVARKLLWVVPVGLVMLLSPGVRAAQLGLVWPQGPAVAVCLQLAPFLLAVFVISTLLYRWRAKSGRSVPGQRAVVGLIPRTRQERRWAFAVAVAAGVIEEVMYRGLLLAAGLSAGMSPLAAILVTSVLFGAGHVYQGWRGVLLIPVFGFAMALFVLSTASVLIAIVLHVLVDLRGLLLVPRVVTEQVVDAPGPERAAAPLPDSVPGGPAGLVRPRAPSAGIWED
jgi:membrane protease YdiL (CAAX protease family)